MDNPKVSAIITTHNRLELLKRAVESVMNQTYTNIELIVVSDNSNDGTDDYCSVLVGITFISIPASESKGGNYARNLGIKASHGEFVAFLDDDDYWAPTKIEKQLKVAKNKNCGFVYCGLKIENVTSQGVHYRQSLPREINSGDVSKKILTSIFTLTSEIFVNRDLLYRVGLFDENVKFWQEYELSIRLAQVTEFHFVKEPLTIYRRDVSDTNRLTNKYYGWKQSVNFIRKKHSNLYRKLNYKEKLVSKQFVWQEAIARCRNNDLMMYAMYYKAMVWMSTLPYRLKHNIVKKQKNAD